MGRFDNPNSFRNRLCKSKKVNVSEMILLRMLTFKVNENDEKIHDIEKKLKYIAIRRK